MKIGKEEATLSLFVDEIISYIRNSKKISTRNILESSATWSTQKSISKNQSLFLWQCEYWERDHGHTLHFTIDWKKISRNKLTKEMKDLYKGTFNFLKKEIKAV